MCIRDSLRGIEKEYRLSRNHLFRRPVKGEYHRLCAQFLGPLHGFFQQGAVAPMYPIKKSQGNDCLVQNLSRSEKIFQGGHGVPLQAAQAEEIPVSYTHLIRIFRPSAVSRSSAKNLRKHR